jgi:hypothetical protein
MYGTVRVPDKLHGTVRSSRFYGTAAVGTPFRGSVTSDYLFASVDAVTFHARVTERSARFYFTPANCIHAHTATETSVRLVFNSAPNNARHAHTATSPGVVYLDPVGFSPADGQHAHTATSPVLTPVTPITANDARHGHTATSPGVAFHPSFDPADGQHAHTATSPAIGYIPPPEYSPEVQAVLDRMSGLSQKEIDAIEVLVDGLVATGDWDNVFDLWAFALNGADFLTGWKRDKFTIAQHITHTVGTGISVTAIDGYMQLGIGAADLEVWDPLTAICS